MKANKDLWGSALDSAPIWVDWSEMSERYQSYAVDTCEKCGKPVLTYPSQEMVHKDFDSDSECDGEVFADEGPMMNYLYPLPSRSEEYDAYVRAILRDRPSDGKRLASLPLCLVHLDEQSWGFGDDYGSSWGLALTGGGMDLSWEICEYFMLLGYLPPIHFCYLPQMAGRGESARDLRIISACKDSLKLSMRRASSDTGHLNDLRKSALKRKRERSI